MSIKHVPPSDRKAMGPSKPIEPQARTDRGEACNATPLPTSVALLPPLVTLLAFQALGELVVRQFDVRVPVALVGMLALLTFLWLRRAGPHDGLKRVSGVLIDHLSLFLIPAGTAIVASFVLLDSDVVPICAAIIVSTVVSLTLTGILATLIQSRQRESSPRETQVNPVSELSSRKACGEADRQ